MKKLSFLILALPCLDLMAQQPASDRLLWYKGKKQNDSTLLTTGGSTIVYRKKSAEVEVKQKKDPFTKILPELKRTDERKKEVVAIMAAHKQAVILYPYAKNTLEEYDNIKKTFTEIADNKINIKSEVTNETAYSWFIDQQIVLRGPMTDILSVLEIPEWVKKEHGRIMKWYEERKNEKTFTIPPPPALDPNCYGCDASKTKEYESAAIRYHNQLFEEEIFNKQKIFSILKFVETLPKKTEFTPIQNDLDKAINLVIFRYSEKSKSLAKQWGHDLLRLKVVIQTLLFAERQKQLFTGSEDSYAEIMDLIRGLLSKDKMDGHLNSAVTNLNYSLLLNVGFWIGLERQKQLLGTGDDYSVGDLLEKLLRLNRFKLSHEYDVKWQGDCCQIKTVLKAEDVFYFAVPDKNCKYILVVEEGTRTKLSESRMVKYDLKEAWRPDVQFIKPKLWFATYPIVRLDLCHSNALMNFDTDMEEWQKDHEKWTEPPESYEGPGGMEIETALERSFLESSPNKEDQEPEEVLTAILGGGTDAKVTDTSGMKKTYEHSMSLIKHWSGYLHSYKVEDEIKNGSKILIEKNFDGRKDNGWNDDGEIVYAWLKVKLEYEGKDK